MYPSSRFLTLSILPERTPLSLNIINIPEKKDTPIITRKGRSSKWNRQNVIQQATDVHGNIYDYSMVSDDNVKCSNSHIPVRCTICEYVWEPTIHHHINHKSGCPECAGKVKWTLERFLQRVIVIHGNKCDYSMVTNEHIQGKDSLVPVRCLICEYFWMPSIHGHINGKTGCPDCAGRVPWTLERFINKASSIHGNKYDYYMITVDHIQGKDSNVPITCNTCNYIWNPTIHGHIYHKYGCPRCKFSKGEIQCAHVLDELGLTYQIQYVIESLPRKRYDFMFIHKDRKYLVEFDGQQHFEFNSFFHSNIESFLQRQQVDVIKTSHAITNGYHIIRISYKDIDEVNHHMTNAISQLGAPMYLYLSDHNLYEYIAKTCQ